MERYAIAIAGPSGVGKTTVADRLIAELPFLEPSRSVTTRPRRNDGRDDEYVYLSVEEFKRCIAEGDVLEYTEYSGNFYGTVRFELDRILSMGRIPILVLDYNGVRALRTLLDYPVFSIYLYSSLDEAAKRLMLRDLSSVAPTEGQVATVNRRKAENVEDYKKILGMTDIFDAFVENADLDTCILEVRRYLDLFASGCTAMPDDKKLRIAEALRADAAGKCV